MRSTNHLQLLLFSRQHVVHKYKQRGKKGVESYAGEKEKFGPLFHQITNKNNYHLSVSSTQLDQPQLELYCVPYVWRLSLMVLACWPWHGPIGNIKQLSGRPGDLEGNLIRMLQGLNTHKNPFLQLMLPSDLDMILLYII